MRLLVEIFLIGALIYLGWEIPFKDRLPGNVAPQVSRPAVAARVRAPVATPPARGQWMYDSNRRSALDTPTPPSGPQASGSWMFDPNHRSALDPPRKKPSPHR